MLAVARIYGAPGAYWINFTPGNAPKTNQGLQETSMLFLTFFCLYYDPQKMPLILNLLITKTLITVFPSLFFTLGPVDAVSIKCCIQSEYFFSF